MLRSALDALPRALPAWHSRALACAGSEVSQALADQLQRSQAAEAGPSSQPSTSTSSRRDHAATSTASTSLRWNPHQNIQTRSLCLSTLQAEHPAPTIPPPLQSAASPTNPPPPGDSPAPTPHPSPFLDDTMAAITAWPSLQHAAAFLDTSRTSLHPIHLTAALRRICALSKGVALDDPDLRFCTTRAVALLGSALPQFLPTELAQCVFRLGQLRVPVEGQTASGIVAALRGQVKVLATGRSVVELLWALHHLALLDPALAAECCAVAMDRMHSLDAKHVAMLASTLALSGTHDWATFNNLTRAIVAILPDFSHVHLSAVVSAFARAAHQDDALFEALAEAASRRVDACQPTHLMQLAQGFARMRHNSGRFLTRAAVRAQRIMYLFNARQVANLAKAYADLRHYDAPLFAALSARALQVLPDMTPRELSSFTWALGRVAHRDEALMATLAGAALAQRQALQNVHLTNVVGTFGKFQMYSEELFAELGAEAAARMEEELKAASEVEARAAAEAEAAREAAEAAAAAREAGHPLPPTSTTPQAADSEAAPQEAPEAFQGHQLGTIARAMALVGHRDERLMGAIAQLAVPLLPGCTAQAMADLAWGFAQLGLHVPELMDAVAAVASDRLPSFSTDQWGDLLWAYAVLGHQSPALQQAATTTVMEVVEPLRANAAMESSLQELGRIVWCFSSLGWQHDALAAAFAQVLPPEEPLQAAEAVAQPAAAEVMPEASLPSPIS